MAKPPAKFVYHALVTDQDDIIQMLAYCVYKSHKDELAIQYKAEGDETYVEKQLKEFSQRTVKDPRMLSSYMGVGQTLLQEVKDQELERAKNALAQIHQDAITQLNQEHQEGLNLLRQQVLDADKVAEEKWNATVKAWAVVQTRPNKFMRGCGAFFKWIGAGISGLLATVFATWILVGFVSIFNTDVRDPARNALKKGVDILIPESPVDLGTVSKKSTEQEKQESKP